MKKKILSVVMALRDGCELLQWRYGNGSVQ